MSDNNVVNIEQNMPHFTIMGPSGNYHVFPVENIKLIIDKKIEKELS